MSAKLWYTVREIALLLHVTRLTAWRLLEPYRARCHLAREGSHPRLVLWVPSAVVSDLRRDRRERWRATWRDAKEDECREAE